MENQSEPRALRGSETRFAIRLVTETNGVSNSYI